MHEKYQISIPCTSDHIIWLRDHIIFQSGLRGFVHVAGALHPEKQYLRSEPNDFQRGEVEGKGGNLYFDKWDYDIKIKYINPL
jgi:hypothetical protein